MHRKKTNSTLKILFFQISSPTSSRKAGSRRSLRRVRSDDEEPAGSHSQVSRDRRAPVPALPEDIQARDGLKGSQRQGPPQPAVSPLRQGLT
jgi:hypothetical protein